MKGLKPFFTSISLSLLSHVWSCFLHHCNLWVWMKSRLQVSWLSLPSRPWQAVLPHDAVLAHFGRQAGFHHHHGGNGAPVRLGPPPSGAVVIPDSLPLCFDSTLCFWSSSLWPGWSLTSPPMWGLEWRESAIWSRSISTTMRSTSSRSNSAKSTTSARAGRRSTRLCPNTRCCQSVCSSVTCVDSLCQCAVAVRPAALCPPFPAVLLLPTCWLGCSTRACWPLNLCLVFIAFQSVLDGSCVTENNRNLLWGAGVKMKNTVSKPERSTGFNTIYFTRTKEYSYIVSQTIWLLVSFEKVRCRGYGVFAGSTTTPSGCLIPAAGAWWRIPA